MNQQIINACLPWAILVIASAIVARILIWFSGAKLNTQRLRSIHSCEQGSVQGISFVLALPFFVMTMMMIVQASHLMIGNIVVHYSAFAAIRSANVWIPANVSVEEPANCIGTRTEIDSDSLGWQYDMGQAGDKYSKIKQAAVLAAFTLGPSRDMGYEINDAQAMATAEILPRLYQGLNPDSVSNSKIPARLRNKLAYSYANTIVDVTVWHRFRENTNGARHPDLDGNMSEIWPFAGPGPGWGDRDAPLDAYDEQINEFLFQANEIGWQDHVTATVTYNLPLLPGPMRLFAPNAPDTPMVDGSGEAYIWPISASATLGNEGQKTLRLYWQEEF